MNSSLKTLLFEIVDYAGLFPPSQVSMKEAVQNYAEYLKSDNSWILGRFIVPVGRLTEFVENAEPLHADKTWRLSVLTDENVKENILSVTNFNQQYAGKFLIDTLELKVINPDEIVQNAKLLPSNLTAYFEFPLVDYMKDFVTALAVTKQRAKIRTGGTTLGAFPPIDEIIRFIRFCAVTNVPFKATAGLHHPLRCVKPLTYEEDAVKGAMNGFLNLFLLACFLRQNPTFSFVRDLMNDSDEKNFVFTDEKILWKEHQIPTSHIKLVRQRYATSFGSCSFTEPLEDLQGFGWL